MRQINEMILMILVKSEWMTPQSEIRKMLKRM